MSPGQTSESGCSGKGAPLFSSGSVITYKRRKRDGSGSGGCRKGESMVSEPGETLRMPHDTFPCNRASNLVVLSRIENNWRKVLQSILLSNDVDDDSDSQRCIQRALICGPFGISDKCNMDSVRTEESSKDHQNLQRHASQANCATRSSMKTSKDPIRRSLNGSRNNDGHECLDTTSIICQNILFDVLTSDKFALLCDLLSENFQSNNIASIFDFSSIISIMKKGDYEQSPGVFDLQIQLIWEKFRKIGQDMALLSDSLCKIPWASYQKQVGRGLRSDLITTEQKYESSETLETRQLDSGHVPNQQSTMESFKQINHVDSCTTTVYTSNDFDPSLKPEQTGLSCFYKISTCKECGAEADGKKSLICDGCEAMYHVSCAKPAIKEIPRRIWYCAVCSLQKNEPEVLDMTSDPHDCLHQNCVVCDRINYSEIKGHKGKISEKTAVISSSRESSPSTSRMEREESPEPSRTASLRLCKQCGTCEDEDKRFLVCSNKHCLYKYYHIRCLKSAQLASQHQPPDCWYCPSCLCRSCLTDKDDDLICLCDACDEGYHVYCMRPPRSTVPKGAWYCLVCNMERARKGMTIYEQWVLQKHGKKDAKLGKRLMDEKLTTEITATSAKKRRR